MSAQVPTRFGLPPNEKPQKQNANKKKQEDEPQSQQPKGQKQKQQKAATTDPAAVAQQQTSDRGFRTVEDKRNAKPRGGKKQSDEAAEADDSRRANNGAFGRDAQRGANRSGPVGGLVIDQEALKAERKAQKALQKHLAKQTVKTVKGDVTHPTAAAAAAMAKARQQQQQDDEEAEEETAGQRDARSKKTAAAAAERAALMKSAGLTAWGQQQPTAAAGAAHGNKPQQKQPQQQQQQHKNKAQQQKHNDPHEIVNIQKNHQKQQSGGGKKQKGGAANQQQQQQQQQKGSAAARAEEMQQLMEKFRAQALTEEEGGSNDADVHGEDGATDADEVHTHICFVAKGNSGAYYLEPPTKKDRRVTPNVVVESYQQTKTVKAGLFVHVGPAALNKYWSDAHTIDQPWMLDSYYKAILQLLRKEKSDDTARAYPFWPATTGPRTAKHRDDVAEAEVLMHLIHPQPHGSSGKKPTTSSGSISEHTLLQLEHVDKHFSASGISVKSVKLPLLDFARRLVQEGKLMCDFTAALFEFATTSSSSSSGELGELLKPMFPVKLEEHVVELEEELRRFSS